MRHVIGFGNPLHGDDGVASAICDELGLCSLPPDVRVFDAGNRVLDALALLTGCEEAILIDAAVPRGQPGRIESTDLAEVINSSGLSTHCAGLGALLRALLAIEPNPPRIRLFTVEATALNRFCTRLSPAVADSVRQVVALVLHELNEP